MSKPIEESSKDFSRLIMTDMSDKIQPMNKLIEDMQARLEEFQTMIYFAKQERMNATNLLTSIYSSQEALTNLFQRIDCVENLVEHVKNTLSAVEQDIEKSEEEIGYTDSTTTKVANIFTPLFKKNTEKSPSPNCSELYKTSDYFHCEGSPLEDY